MRRMIAFLLLAFSLCAIKYFQKDDYDFFDNYEKIVFVSSERYEELSNFIENGNDYIYVIKNDNSFNQNFLSNYNIKGISYYFSL